MAGAAKRCELVSRVLEALIEKSDQSKPHTGSAIPKPFRFGIPHLLYVTALIASGLVVAGAWSLLVSVGVLAGWLAVYRDNEFGFSWSAIALLFLGMLVWLLLPTVQVNPSAPPRLICLNNMKQCVLAMHNWQSSKGHFPPAYTLDPEGNPMHSWRVRILPFIEEGVLHSQYDFKEPWNGPHNSKLADQMPDCFRCYSAPYSASHTSYKLVSDPEAFFDGDKLRSFEDATDGASSTIGLIEDCQNPVNWLQPEGISIEDAIAQILSKEAFHCHREESLLKTTFYGSAVFTLDGAGHRVSPNADPEFLRRALKARDGHSPDASDFTGSHIVHKPQGYLAVAIYLFLLALPGWFLRKVAL